MTMTTEAYNDTKGNVRRLRFLISASGNLEF